MKKILKTMVVAAAGLLVLYGCSKDNTTPTSQDREFQLLFSSEKPATIGDTRTQFADGSVIWSAGDKISVTYTVDGTWVNNNQTGNGVGLYPSTDAVISEGGLKATFNVSGSFSAVAGSAYDFYALYPSALSQTTIPNAPSVTVTLPAAQSPSATSFDAAADLMIAKSVKTYTEFPPAETISLLYNRLVAHGCVTLYGLPLEAGETITGIAFTAPSGVAVVGDITFDFETQAVTQITASANTVTLNYSDVSAAGGEFAAWFCSLPFEVASGEPFAVEVKTSLGTYTRTITANANGIVFGQNRLNTLRVNMASADFVPDDVDTPRNYYVKADASSSANGLTWDAPTSLSSAIANAAAGSTIHIAEGTYNPEGILTGRDASDQTKTFEISRNVTIIGGYPANAAQGAVSNPATYKTILDGNGKSFHTVVVSAPKSAGEKVSITGVTIKGGKSLSGNSTTTSINSISLPDNNGAGIALVGTNVELANCIISENAGDNASGLWSSNSEVTITGCTITNNTSTATGDMGGTLKAINTRVLFSDCVISNNGVSNNGMFCITTAGSGTSNATFDGCYFTGNSTSGVAAGIYLYTAGGALDAFIINSTFADNTSVGRGGAIYARSGVASGPVNLTCVNSTFSANTAGSNGAAVAMYGSATMLVNTTLISCTLTGNISTHATNNGTITLETAGNTFKAYNTILSGNTVDVRVANGTASYYNTFIGSQFYDSAGAAQATTPTFTASTMLAALANNGGSTLTHKLIGNASTNPAFGNGMTATALKAMATADISADTLGADQTGTARTDTDRIVGACVK